MISLHIVAALVCLLVDHAFAVVELTDATFYDYAKDKEVLLVDFYAPWCGDCKALEPDFESAATSLGTRSLDLAKVDCFGAGKGLCATYGIKRWPTLKNFNRGSYTGDYNGGLSASEIAGYITTVENSVTPASNPYAMVVPQPIQQACISRCKIAKIPNKGTCFTKCKDKPFVTHNGPKKLVGMKMVAPKPVINEKSCAKCRIPQPAGRSKCTRDAMLMCIELEKQLIADTNAKLRQNSIIHAVERASPNTFGLSVGKLSKENQLRIKVNMVRPIESEIKLRINKLRKDTGHLAARSGKEKQMIQDDRLAVEQTGALLGYSRKKHSTKVNAGTASKIKSSADNVTKSQEEFGVTKLAKRKNNSTGHARKTRNNMNLSTSPHTTKSEKVVKDETHNNISNKPASIPINESGHEAEKKTKEPQEIVPAKNRSKQLKGMKMAHKAGGESEKSMDDTKLVKNSKLTQKPLEMMSPREALKMPYAKDDK